jgi:type III secretory pathway lipoprotein EscJ
LLKNSLTGPTLLEMSGIAYQELRLAYPIKQTANRHSTPARVSVFS